MFSTRKISVFKFFLITYIISISIPLIMSVTLHQKLLRVIDNYNEEKYQGILSQSSATIDHIWKASAISRSRLLQMRNPFNL